MKTIATLLVATAVLAMPTSAASVAEGKKVYDAVCAACHNTGAAGAPKLGDVAAWMPRFEGGGVEYLTRSALQGKGAMPARGGNATLSDAAVQSAVLFIVAQVGEKLLVRTPAAPTSAKAAPPAASPTASVASAPTAAAPSEQGQKTYQAACAACHASGAAGAPKVGDAGAWGPRIKGGVTGLYASALKGKNAMPAKGGNAALADGDVRAAVDYMVAQASPKAAPASAATKTAVGPAAAPAGPAPRSAESAAAVQPNAVPTPIAAAASAPRTATVAPTPAAQVVTAPPSTGDVNAFNRLLRAPGKRNLPPTEDGIHDPTNDGTTALQPPLAAFAAFAKSSAGNRVDWVRTLADGTIRPRADRADPNAVPAVMDLNIVREVKGSMPDVVYPHKQHTEWLDCSNCHPAIFIPQKGANQISMASIMLGQKCGVCHGKVAFPISECRLCHSRNKTTATAAGAVRP